MSPKNSKASSVLITSYSRLSAEAMLQALPGLPRRLTSTHHPPTVALPTLARDPCMDQLHGGSPSVCHAWITFMQVHPPSAGTTQLHPFPFKMIFQELKTWLQRPLLLKQEEEQSIA